MDNVLAKINAIKEKIIFGGIIIFIVYVLIGIFACIAEIGNVSSYSGSITTFSKFLQTTAIFGLCFLCFIDNLNKISNKDKFCRIFAIFSMIVVPFFLIIYCLGTWEVVKFTECAGDPVLLFGYSYCTHESLSIFGKIAVILGATAALGTVGALTMSIKTHNRIVINVAKTAATLALTVATIIVVYLVLAASSNALNDSSTIASVYAMEFCYVTWICLTILSFYLSRFDNGVAPTPIRPLNAKVVSASAPAVLTIEEVKEEKAETIYPEPTHTPIHHVDGVNLNATTEEPKEKPEEPHDASLHASPGEPLFEEHPTIGPAVSGTTHDDFSSLENQEDENKEVL